MNLILLYTGGVKKMNKIIILERAIKFEKENDNNLEYIKLLMERINKLKEDD